MRRLPSWNDEAERPFKSHNLETNENMNEFYIILAVLVVLALVAYNVWSAYSETSTVWEHEHALHYRHGKFIGRLEAGKHRFWGRGHEVERFDGRWQEAVIQGQEFLTADKAPVKVSGIVRYRICDAELFKGASVNAYNSLHSAVQIALRDVIGAAGIEEVLAHKAELGKRLKELVEPVAKQFGYELDVVQVRDLMIVGDLKRVFTQVMTAKQEALASLEKARGEAAAIRVMGNAARVFENNPALLQLKFLKALESGAGYNNQLILGSLDPFTSFLKK